eukprot:3536576-Prymnesium_polylepis.1
MPHHELCHLVALLKLIPDVGQDEPSRPSRRGAAGAANALSLKAVQAAIRGDAIDVATPKAKRRFGSSGRVAQRMERAQNDEGTMGEMHQKREDSFAARRASLP